MSPAVQVDRPVRARHAGQSCGFPFQKCSRHDAVRLFRFLKLRLWTLAFMPRLALDHVMNQLLISLLGAGIKQIEARQRTTHGAFSKSALTAPERKQSPVGFLCNGRPLTLPVERAASASRSIARIIETKRRLRRWRPGDLFESEPDELASGEPAGLERLGLADSAPPGQKTTHVWSRSREAARASWQGGRVHEH